MTEKTFKERCKDAEKTTSGDVWQHRKTGKRVTVDGRPRYDEVRLHHEGGQETVKKDHYLASDYFLVKKAALVD